MIVICANCREEIDEPNVVIEVEGVHDCPNTDDQLELTIAV